MNKKVEVIIPDKAILYDGVVWMPYQLDNKLTQSIVKEMSAAKEFMLSLDKFLTPWLDAANHLAGDITEAKSQAEELITWMSKPENESKIK